MIDLFSYPGWIAARAHGPTKEKYADIGFSAHAKNGPRWGQMGSEGFFPTNPDLAYILGRTDFDFDNFYFLIFGDPKFPDFLGYQDLGTEIFGGTGPRVMGEPPSRTTLTYILSLL